MGQKRLQNAIASFQTNHDNSKISVEWKAYIIDPNAALEGEEFEAYSRRRWGSSSWTNRLKQEGRKSGAAFQNWIWWSNTLRSHRLVRFAQERYGVETGKSNAAIFNALYEEGQNVSLLDTLVRIGTNDLNLPDANELRGYLESSEGEAEVKAEMERGRRMYQISGVPFFVIGKEGGDGDPYGLSGAQKEETLLKVFEELSEEK